MTAHGSVSRYQQWYFAPLSNTMVGLILVDPTDADLLIPKPTNAEQEEYERIPQEPLQGGFENFERQRYSAFCAKRSDGPQKSSLMASILHYYQHIPPGLDLTKPSTLALSYYPLRIAAAEWTVYTLVMNRYVRLYEYSFRSGEHRSTEDDIIELQRWRRRAKQGLWKLHLVELFLAEHLDLPSKSSTVDSAPYRTLLQDYRHLSTQIEHYSRALELILPVAATIIQLKDTRRAITEAVNVRYLTYIALVFMPLTFVSSLFSMQEGFLPGQESFKIYIALALPLVIIVLVFSSAPLFDFRRWGRLRGFL
jgi:hypothetical protein